LLRCGGCCGAAVVAVRRLLRCGGYCGAAVVTVRWYAGGYGVLNPNSPLSSTRQCHASLDACAARILVKEAAV
ncbi:MAG: hypothetical protein P1U77_22110, partial [Rubripirellula sp.]|nr:hypothetical protein [Rubripirellula sp.]